MRRLLQLRRHAEHRERATLDRSLDEVLKPVDWKMSRLGDRGAQILDVRDPRNMPRATSPAASISAWRPVRHLGRHGTGPCEANRDHRRTWSRTEAAMRLGRIGFDHIMGYLRGGCGTRRASRPRLANRTCGVSYRGRRVGIRRSAVSAGCPRSEASGKGSTSGKRQRSAESSAGSHRGGSV